MSSAGFLHLSVAGKVILLGEYAVLSGAPALVAALAPRFTLRARALDPQAHSLGHESQVGSSHGRTPHARSPLGRLMRWAQAQGLPPVSFELDDPYQGAGGFGASTAEFALAYLAYERLTQKGYENFHERGGKSSSLPLALDSWVRPYELYRDLMSDEPITPSGADLVGQWQGGACGLFPQTKEVQAFELPHQGSPFLVFSATRLVGRKVPTHEHLAHLAALGFLDQGSELFQTLSQITLRGMNALKACDLIAFGRALDGYAQALHQAELEVPGATEDRLALRALPHVLGVKGAGALQSDALVVLLEHQAPNRKMIIEQAQRRGLTLVADGIQNQKGVG
ncbi:MAG: hypothetical protein ACO3A2_09550 [Bdellovibrionia bacterium]